MKKSYNLLSLLLVFFFVMQSSIAQTLHIENTEDAHSENFKVPVLIDSIKFNSFNLKIKTNNNSLKIDQVLLNKKLSKGSLNFNKTNEGYIINYSSDSSFNYKKK